MRSKIILKGAPSEKLNLLFDKCSNNNQICYHISKDNELVYFLEEETKLKNKPIIVLLYHYKSGLEFIPKCICGTDRKYHCDGYRPTCGKKKCINLIREEKKKATCLVKYGKEYVTQVDSIKDKMTKSIFDRYGFDNPTKSKEILDRRRENNIKKYGYTETLSIPSIREKISNTNIIKYGYKSPLSSPEVREKIYNTNIIKYGFINPQQNIDVKNKSSKTFSDNCLSEKIDDINNLGYEIISNIGDNFNLECDKGHLFNISRSWLNLKIRNGIKICSKCLGNHSKSTGENDLFDFIKTIYIGDIITSDRLLLNGKEIDIYLPDIKIAIEYNGLYWHSELHKEDKYHLNKTEECEIKDVQLIHIFEDEWLNKKEIVKSRLINMLGKSNKIYARKCFIRDVDNSSVREFLNKNHIQGFVGSKVKLGLFYNDELVSLMTFGDLRRNLGQNKLKDNYELLRFCNVLNTTVIGGASKLFKYFINNYRPNKIISYADRRWSNGNLYDKLGFEFISNTEPSWFYNMGGIRVGRFAFRKDKLVSEGFNQNKTARQIMIERGYYRIYDCGTKKYEFKISK